MRKWLLYGNMHVAMLAGVWLAATFAWMNLAIDLYLVLFGASFVFVIYQVDHAVLKGPADSVNRPERVEWIESHAGWVRSSISVAALLIVISSFQIHRSVWVFGLITLLGMTLYYGRPATGGKPRGISGLSKSIAVVLAWVLGSLVFPVVQAGIWPGAEIFILAFSRVAFVVPNVLWFEWHDREGDPVAILGSYSEVQLRLWSSAIAGTASILMLVAAMVLSSSDLVILESIGLFGGALWLSRFRPTNTNLWLLDVWLGWPFLSVLYFVWRSGMTDSWL